MNVTCVNLEHTHWPEVSRIYAEGLETGDATFEREVSGWQNWDQTHREECRLVAVANQVIVGWAALSSISHREVYAGVTEVSVYVSAAARGRGVGTQLLNSVIAESERAGIWTLQASIFPENRASIALHHRCGFRVVGIRRRLGRQAGAWRDVVLMERRSEAPQFQ